MDEIEVRALERQCQEQQRLFSGSWIAVTSKYKEVEKLCQELERIQGADNQRLQELCRELAEIGGAEDQQKHIARVIANEKGVVSRTEQVGAHNGTLVKSTDKGELLDLLLYCDEVRSRGRRFDAERVRLWAAAVRDAVCTYTPRPGAFHKALAGLKKELFAGGQ